MTDETIRLTTAQALVRYLSVQFSERDGVRRRVIPGIFGIFGHGNVAGLGQALQEHGQDLDFYQPKNEQSSVHAAIGFAKANDRLSTLACTASIGPGATNLVTGAATATVNRLPVLLLPADTFAGRQQGNVLQQLESPHSLDLTVNDALRPVSVFFDRIARPEQLLVGLPAAISVLLDPAATGAVTLALHQDVQGEAYDYPVAFLRPRTWRVVRRPPDNGELAAAAELLRRSHRPLIIAGGGVRYSGAQRELAEFSARLGIPVAETSAGKGVLAADADLLAGGIGVNGTRVATELAQAADVVLHVGSRLTDFTTGSRSIFAHPDVTFVGINVCVGDAHKLGAETVVADARVSLAALQERLLDGGWSTGADYRAETRSRIRDWLTTVDAEVDLAQAGPGTLTQGHVIRLVNGKARDGDVMIGAAGSTPGDLLKLWRQPDGGRTHLEFGFSCMGHEIPAGIGYRLALRDTVGEIYVMIGDGTYLMANTDLVTAVQDGTKITVILVVNDGFQSIHGLQRRTTAASMGTEFRGRDANGALDGPPLAVDYATNARSMGCAAFDVDGPDDLVSALGKARELAGPTVIVVRVRPISELPASGAWWDLGIAQTSELPAVQEVAAEHRRQRRHQRFYG